MYNHEFCNLLSWYECMNIFHAYTCQATWIGAHLLDVIDIWFKKLPPEPPDILQYSSSQAFDVPSSGPIKEQADDKGCPPPPQFI